MKTHAELKKTLLRDPQVRAEYDALEDEFALIAQLIEARARAGLTQAQLAQRMGTQQAAVARLEGGRVRPTLATLRPLCRSDRRAHRGAPGRRLSGPTTKYSCSAFSAKTSGPTWTRPR